MVRDARLVVGKDLRLEWRSRVTLSQLLPFALLVLILFAFALDPDRRILEEATPGLFWLAVLFSMLLAIQRASSSRPLCRAGITGLVKLVLMTSGNPRSTGLPSVR